MIDDLTNAHKPALQPGEIICAGRYRLVRPLGEGSFGLVWLAEEIKSRNTQVAIKIARANEEAAARFDREITLSRQLDHPNLLHAETVEQDGGRPLLVLPYMSGGSLQQRLQAKKPLPVEEALSIAAQVADGLAYLHEQDIIHRDLHPGNILFTSKNVPRIADLGLAQNPQFSGSTWYGQKTGQHPGNISYHPPEATARGDAPLLPLMPCADVYMLGAVLWEMLTGRLYYNKKGTLPSQMNAAVPAWLDDLVMGMLAKNPDDRPRDGKAAASLLENSIRRLNSSRAQEPVQPLVIIYNKLKRRKKTSLLIAGSLLIVMVSLFFIVRSISRLNDETPQKTTQQAALFPLETTGIPTLTHTEIPIATDEIPTPVTTVSPTRTTSSLPTDTVTPTHPVPTYDGFGVPMVLIEGGDFRIGGNPDIGLSQCQELFVNNECRSTMFEDADPIHTITLDYFYIDIFEVTNQRYAQCVAAGVCSVPHKISSATRAQYYGEELFNDYPVVNVTWQDALTYCEYRQGRLPTEAEWEKAARGNSLHTYPWGDTFNTYLNFCDARCGQEFGNNWANYSYNDGYADTAPVGTYPNGASLYGVFDMAGNVWEWVNDWYERNYYDLSEPENPTGPPLGEYRVVRGGDYSRAGYTGMTWYRDVEIPSNSSANIGFRCVKTEVP